MKVHSFRLAVLLYCHVNSCTLLRSVYETICSFYIRDLLHEICKCRRIFVVDELIERLRFNEQFHKRSILLGLHFQKTLIIKSCSTNEIYNIAEDLYEEELEGIFDF